jgi:uncharacterized protein YegP (UPF0339 family)
MSQASRERYAVATVVIYRDKAGEFRWQAKARNGEPMADSGEGYTSVNRPAEIAVDLFPDAAIIAPHLDDLSAGIVIRILEENGR